MALSQETDQELSSMSHHQSYPLREAFFVECHDPSKTLKCRINVECDGKELVTMLITPYIPIKSEFMLLSPVLSLLNYSCILYCIKFSFS